MPVIITPVTSPADAAPIQKAAENSPSDAIPVQSGAASTPIDSSPLQNTAKASPEDITPSEITAESNQVNAVPVQSSAVISPAYSTPSENDAVATPADDLPSQKSPNSSPAHQLPSEIASESSQIDAAPSQRQAVASPDDPVPAERLPQATPEDVVPVQSSTIATPGDATPSQSATVSSPGDSIPSQKAAQPSPSDSIPSEIVTVETPAVNGIAGADGVIGFHSGRPSAKMGDENQPPAKKSTAQTPGDTAPSQKSTSATPSNALPSQIETAATPAISGIAGADGIIGYHSSRPTPKVESAIIPFTHPRICYQTYLDTGTVTVSSGDITAAKSKLTYDKWQPSGSNEWVKVDAGQAVEVDYLAIAAHNITGRTVSLQWSDSGYTGWVDAASVLVESVDSVVILLNSSIEKRYWRLFVSGATGMSIGVIMIGKALAVQRSINAGHSPITLSRNTVIRPAVSERGQWLGRNVIRSGLSTNIALSNLYADWYRANFDDFVESARTEPFFFAWRPETYPDEVAYCWTTDDISPQNVGNDRINVSFGVDAHA